MANQLPKGPLPRIFNARLQNRIGFEVVSV